MSIFKKIILISIILFIGFSINSINSVWASDPNIIMSTDRWDSRNDILKNFQDKNEHFWLWSRQWAQWIYYTLVSIAQSLKNLFFWFATLFYIIVVIKLLVAGNTEEEAWKFKKWIIWITAGLMIMQIAYAFVLTLYAKSIWESLAFNLIDNIINPFIGLMEVLASIFFIAMAIFAFYKMISANWKEDEITKAKMSILYAIAWFILIKIAKLIVEWVYWKLECSKESIAWFSIITTNCISSPQAWALSWTIMQIINWANWFIWLITLLLIIYAWFNILFSAGDEEKIKKAKHTILYIIIWLLLLVTNYLILTFFLLPESII